MAPHPRDHGAKPRPVGGRVPSKGRQACAVCGDPISRVGTHKMSDGVRGVWKHEKVAGRG